MNLVPPALFLSVLSQAQTEQSCLYMLYPPPYLPLILSQLSSVSS